MKRQLVVLIGIGLLQACSLVKDPVIDSNEPCSEGTLNMIEQRSPTGDGQGHGPDIGSDEWHSVVEFRLGVRGDASVPVRDTRQWCNFIESLLDNSTG